ncbi:MAG: PilN domain-containing protein [Kiritimatiellia bacterium]
MATAWITGVCLRPNRLEWTVLRRAKEAWEIASQGREDVPAAEGEVGWIPAAALKARLKSFRGRVAVALPTDRALVRVALLPSTDAAELRGMAELQTDKFSPFPVETVAAGAEVLEAAGTSSLVALAVVRREDVDAVGAAFQSAGAPPDVVDVEALGWWWGLRQSGALPTHGSQLVLRAEPSGMEMALVRDGAPLAFRALPGGPAAGDAAARAEWIGTCAEELADALTALETEWGGAGAPTLHVFHGPEFPAADLDALRQAVGLETAFAHPLEGLPSAAEGIARRQAAPARPLAMDLAPETWRTADVERRTRRRLLRAATAFGAVWLLALGAFGTSLHLQRGRLARLQAQVEAREGPAQEIRRLRTKSLEFAQYADRTHAALECLRVVAGTLPEGVDLTAFVYRKGTTLSLRGEADAADKVYAFIQALEQAALLPEVKSEGISTRNTPLGTRSQFGATLTLPGAGGEGEP